MALPHEVLGVPHNADEATINAAFRRAAKKYHPDLNGGNASGIRHLRRLIAARDFLAKQKKRLPYTRSVRYRLTQLRKPGGRRRFLFASALIGAVSLLAIPVLFVPSGATRPQISAAGWISTTVMDPEIPDAGSAEIKAIRDIQEASSYPMAETGMEMEPEPRLRSAARRHHFMQPSNQLEKAITHAAFLMSKTFRRLSSQ